MANDDKRDDAHAPGGDLRSFGRRRGRKPSERQARLLADVLPRVAVDLSSLKVGGQSELWLEIGFGGGEHLVWQARANRHVGFIGSEPFEDGIIKVLDEIERDDLENIRILGDDVRPLIRVLPDASIGRVFILYPDPWPKRRHQKRRLVQSSLVAELARVMQPGAELRIATDIGDYARTALIALCGNPHLVWAAAGPADWRVRPVDWPETRYEQKARREGRRSYYLRFLRR